MSYNLARRDEIFANLKTNELGEYLASDVNGAFEAELKSFKEEYVEGKNTEELLALEQEVINEQDQYNEYLQNVKYKLPKKSVSVLDDTFTAAKVAKFIHEFINKNEIDWRFTLSYAQLCKLWKDVSEGSVAEVSYHEYDSTLRILGAQKFKGYEAWVRILAVNEYTKAIHPVYTVDMAWTQYLVMKHNAIIDQITLNKPAPVGEFAHEKELPEEDQHA